MKTVKLGIAARRTRVSSMAGINSIIREAFHAFRISGLSGEAIQFFRGLARNNNRDWFLRAKRFLKPR